MARSGRQTLNLETVVQISLPGSGGSMSNPDILFRGIPRGPTRGYTASVVMASKASVVVVPCCGSFSLAAVAREAGAPTERIVCGDISLYSTALGMAIMSNDWRLDLKPEAGEIGELVRKYVDGAPIAKAAAVMYAIRVLQYDRKNQTIFLQHVQRELMQEAENYIGQLMEAIVEMAQALRGLRYEARDMWLTLDEYRGDPKALLLVNPPRYTGGYGRMFKGIERIFDWDEPKVAQFTEKDYARLMQVLGASPALTLMYYATPNEDPAPLWGEPWQSVFADRPSNSKSAAINWIVANRNPIPPQVSRAKITLGEARFKLFTGEVKPDSRIEARVIPRDVADYYKDLFIHRLPGSMSEKYVGLLLDGCLAAILAFTTANMRSGHGSKDDEIGDIPANLTFAFTVPHERYERLHKLTLLSMLSEWFWNDIFSREKHVDLTGLPRRVQSTMLTPHPENKTARGTGMEMAKRAAQKDGTFKLTYYGNIVQRTREETLALWLQKFATKTR